MFRHVNVVGTVSIPVPKKDLGALLWNIERIPEFDLKADHVVVSPETEGSGFYAVKARFAGIGFSVLSERRGVLSPGGSPIRP